MSDEYEFYQGVVLRRLVVDSDLSLILRPFVNKGRVNAFVVNGKIGVFVKHSTARMSPWPFTFTLDQASDLLDLEAKFFDSFVVFVCGDDGLVTLDVARLHEVMSFEDSERAWLRIQRKPRSQYTVTGNRTELANKVANGVFQIHETIIKRLRERQAS